MKKVIIMCFLAGVIFAASAQGPFKPVAPFATQAEKAKLKAGETLITQKWAWRFDATIVIDEINRNTVTKQWTSTAFSAVGPAVGYQHYIPTSAVDSTPVNNYGISAGVALGESIYNPELTKLKIVVAANIWQYFKFGVTITPKPVTDVGKLGLFFGGGITF